MGLRDKIQAKAGRAFDRALSDAVRSFTGSREIVSDEYDPISGAYPTETISFTGRGVFGGYSVHEVDDTHIRRADVKLTALANELLMLDGQGAVTSTAAEPRINDTIDGYTVVNVGKDPAEATYSIQLRKT